MSVLWVLPLLFYAGGAVLLLAVTRRAAEAGAELRAECSPARRAPDRADPASHQERAAQGGARSAGTSGRIPGTGG